MSMPSTVRTDAPQPAPHPSREGPDPRAKCRHSQLSCSLSHGAPHGPGTRPKVRAEIPRIPQDSSKITQQLGDRRLEPSLSLPWLTSLPRHPQV